MRRAVAAPGPEISRYERPRAVRRSRSGALIQVHGPAEGAALDEAIFRDVVEAWRGLDR